MPLNIGIAGAGGFAAFAAEAFIKAGDIKIVAVTDINPKAAAKLAEEFAATVYTDYEAFSNDPNIDLVYIATPPYLHYQQSKAALSAGKHVLCEKPAALRSAEATALASLARASGLLYVVNLMQRYNPLYTFVRELIQKKLLGNFLHGFFENYASDESLHEEHWFWDEAKSGGIFIEHGVHFFDMFSGWLGQGKVLNALELKRHLDKKDIIDRVQTTVLYDKGIVNFYHGFNQPKVLDRQEMRLQFETGDITLYGWVPTKIKLHALLQKQQLQWLQEWLSDAVIVHNNAASLSGHTVHGRFTEIKFDEHVTLEFGHSVEKQQRYQEILTAMIADQWNWIKDQTHERTIDEHNAIESLQMAEAATRMAKTYVNA